MLYLKFLFAVSAIYKAAANLSDEEIIEPVDMAYYCIDVEIDEECRDKSTILLLHGMGASKRIWNRTDTFLAHQTKRRVCAVDFRNHGDSPWNNRTDVEALAVDIDHFLDKQGIDKVNVIGHSLGGKTGIHYTLNNPDRVDSLIVEDMTTNTVPEEVFLQMSFISRVQKAALDSIPEGITSQDQAAKIFINILNKKFEENHPLNGKIHVPEKMKAVEMTVKLLTTRPLDTGMGSKDRVPDELVDAIEIKLVAGKWQFKSNMDVLDKAVQNLESFLTESTGLYEGPTMFIYGTTSPLKVNEDKENILNLFPNAELVPVEGAGHMIHGLFREFEDAVIPFLNNVN